MRDQRRGAGGLDNAFEVGRRMQAAFIALERRDFPAAIGHLEAVIRLTPKDARAYVTLGVVFQMIGRPVEAEAAFTSALRIAPNEPPALFGLGATKAESGRLEEAEELLALAVRLDPSNTQAFLVLARTLRDQGRFEEAESVARSAIAAHPNEAPPYSALGIQLQELGRFEEARALFTKALELDPNHAFAYLGLVQGRRVTENDRELIHAMEELASRPQLREEDRVDLLSGLGKAFDDLHEFERAMECFSESNRVANASANATRFSEEEFLRIFRAIRTIFTADFIQSHRTKNDASPKPIFIVGMMRSGTTLVEQIISSHPSVTAGNEIRFWTPETYRCIDVDRLSFDFHRALGCRKKYNKMIRKIAPTAAFVTDKMPDNYRVLGLLSALYPEAKIIHCSRHPVDTCLSILATPLRKPPDYARDPDKLVFVYRQYQELMAHWREVLPASSLLEVKYEDLIRDRERLTREMVEFCELDWNESCLRPEDNPRPVITASLWQARQPVYRTSVERWRNYEPWLGSLSQLVESAD